MTHDGRGIDTDTQEIITALAELLDEIENQDLKRDSQARGAAPVSFQDFAASAFKALDPSQIPTRARSRVLRLTKTPVRNACKNAVHDLGTLLHEKGGIDLMHHVYDELAYNADGSPRRRANILDKTWDGIGDGSGGWTA